MNRKQTLYKAFATIIIFVGLAFGQQALAETVTYAISGSSYPNPSNPSNLTCQLDISASGNATGSVSTTWDYNTATSESLTLPGGITLAFGTDKTSQGMATRNANERISTEGLNAGVYVLRLINGKNVRTQKIVVK